MIFKNDFKIIFISSSELDGTHTLDKRYLRLTLRTHRVKLIVNQAQVKD